MEILIIAEKHEQGKKIAEGMQLSTHGNACFRGEWKGRSACVCWAAGHLLTQEQPDVRKPDANWYSPDSLLPLPNPGKLIPIQKGKKLLSGIKGKIKEAKEIWIATDPDREGEGIGWNILEYAGYQGTVKRLWLSESLKPNDIKKAVSALRDGKETIAIWRAQQARSWGDWYWQFLVRGYTMMGRNGLMGKNLGQGKGRASVVSTGSKQGATTRLIVERDQAIANFKPIDHFVVAPTAANCEWNYHLPQRQEPIAGSEDKNGNPKMQWVDDVEPAHGREFDDKGCVFFTDEAQANAFAARLKNNSLHIISAKKGTKLRNPPTPHSLTSLQRHMSKKLGLSSNETLKIADKIRLDGFLTYPRTEHGELPISMYNKEDLSQSLGACAVIPTLKEAAENMLQAHPQEKIPACYVKTSMEHHGIIPTGAIPPFTQWNEKELAVYLACAEAFVVALHPAAEYTTLSAVGSVQTDGLADENPIKLKQNFEQLIQPGWLKVAGRKVEFTQLPDIKADENHTITEVSVTAKRTKPPKHFTENSLLGAMLNAGRLVVGEDAKVLRKAKGIGTPATRGTIIETIKVRDYVSLSKRQIAATAKGFDFIKYMPDNLTNLSTTAQYERQLAVIETAASDSEARALRDQFIEQQKQMVSGHIQDIITAMKDVKTTAGGTGHTGKPTKKMAELIKKIGKQTDLDTTEALASFSNGKAFIDKHISKLQSTNPPTTKMLAFAKKIAEKKGLKLPKAIDESFDVCKDFLNKNAK